MDQKNSIHDTIPHVPVEGSRWGDAEFYGNWLSAALSLLQPLQILSATRMEIKNVEL